LISKCQGQKHEATANKRNSCSNLELYYCTDFINLKFKGSRTFIPSEELQIHQQW